MNDLQSYLDNALKQVEISNNSIDRSANYSDYDINKEVSDIIAFARNDAGLTQQELARITGISQANISKIENGNYHPSVSILKRIADGLGKRLVIEYLSWEDVE